MKQTGIDDYLEHFGTAVVGSSAEKREWRAELVSYLDDAQENGDLEGTLKRLGQPREAAAAFRAARPLPLASTERRFMAQAIDFAPLLIVAGVIAADQLAQGGRSFSWGFPIGLFISSSDPLWVNVARGVAALWSSVGLALIESALGGRTPGKALLGLRTVSDDGTTVTLGQALTRRWSILLGLVAWVDWAGALFTERRQRLLDLLARTIVVEDPERKDLRGGIHAAERESI